MSLPGGTLTMRIDIHTHFQSLAYIQHLHERGGLPRAVLEDGNYVIQCGAGVNVPVLPKMLDMDEKLRDMDASGIDVAVLSHGVPLGPDALGGAEADDWAACINDNLARIIACHPDRFVGLGTIGFGDIERSTVEVDRCIGQLGFRGMQVFSNIDGNPMDAPHVLPVIRHIGALGVPIHLHPAVPLNRIALGAASLQLPLGFPFDTSLNTLRLIRSGILDELSDLHLIVAHVGGVIPYLKARIVAYSAPSPLISDAPDLAHPIQHYLDNLYVDTVCYDRAALDCCYQSLGASQMLYGTDHPFGAYGTAAGLLEQLDCSVAERELIYSGNAQRLFNLV
jgi:predicted TIM-barrel fold metal-dependent hydrolase